MRSCEREPTASMTTSSLFIITRAFRMRLIYDLNRKRAYTQQLQFSVHIVLLRIPILPEEKYSTKK